MCSGFGAKRHSQQRESLPRPTCAPRRVLQEQKIYWREQSAAVSERSDRDNERPPGNRAAFLSRENSSNGGSKTIRTFWKKSYGRPKVSVKEFFQNKCICFQ